MLATFGMDLPDTVEDILSDEYEEGEILDDDILYENVSSLEEFSDDDRKDRDFRVEARKVKTKRKKEHKCKVDSPCRVERSGKHCYARIRRRSSLESKSPKSFGGVEETDRKQRPSSAKSTSPNRGFKRDTFSRESPKTKGRSEVRKRGFPYYFQHDDRQQPFKKVVPDRRCKKNRRSSVEDHRSGNWKRKSRSPSPKRPIVETQRAVAKSSLLERLVGSGSMHLKTTDESRPGSEDHAGSEHFGESNSASETGNGDKVTQVCPANIPVPPAPKAESPERPKQEIEELQLRLTALKTAIMKKHTERKKRLAASKKRDSTEDSFTKYAMKELLDECESIPTPPPPPGTDWGPPLDDNRWSEEDMVIDAESVCGDVVIESNIPATGQSLRSFDFPAASSPSSHDKLPCCRGNPIPVITPHRKHRTRDIEVKKPPSSVIPVVFDTDDPPSGSQPPKYLKEINSNRPTRRRRRVPILGRGKASLGWHQRKRRNSFRQTKPPKPLPERPKEDDDEDELRKLALMSVKPKTIAGGMLSSVGTTLNPLTVDTGPSTVDKVGSPAKNQSPAEPWDDLDEDILRAQLLSSLSRNIPDAPPPPKQTAVEVKKQTLTKKINKENLYTRNAPHAAPKPQKKNPVKFINPNNKSALTPPLNPPKVEKFIIRVSDSETSEDEELKTAKSQVLSGVGVPRGKSEIELSIDRLLEEARKETELIQKASQLLYPDFSVPDPDHNEVPPDSAVEHAENVAPQVVESAMPSPKDGIEENVPGSVSQSQDLSDLSAWQREEFERQKRTMARKGSLIEAAKQKIRDRTDRPSPDVMKTVETPAGLTDADKNLAAASSTEVAPDEPESSTDCSKDTVQPLPVVDSLLARENTDESSPVISEVTDGDEREVRKVVEELLTRVCVDVSQPVEPGRIDPPSELRARGNVNEIGKSVQGIKLEQGGKKSAVISPKTASAGVSPAKRLLQNSKSVPSVSNVLPRPSPKKPVQNPVPSKITLSNAPAKSSKTEQPNGLAQKAPFTIKDSSYAAKALAEMIELVTGFENGMSEYGHIKKEYVAVRKQLVAVHRRMTQKRQELVGMRGTIENKKRLLDSTLTMDTSSLSPLPDIREQPKPSSRDSELFSLRYKEICLRAQFAAMGLDPVPKTAAKPAGPAARVTAPMKNSRPLENPVVSPRKRLRLRPRQVERLTLLTTNKKLIRPPQLPAPSSKPVAPKTELPSSSKKLVISVRDKDSMDPLIPLCPYDISGVCKDEECKYQHLRTE